MKYCFYFYKMREIFKRDSDQTVSFGNMLMWPLKPHVYAAADECWVTGKQRNIQPSTIC